MPGTSHRCFPNLGNIRSEIYSLLMNEDTKVKNTALQMPQPGIQMANVPSQLLVEGLNSISECQGSEHAGIRHLLEEEFMNNLQCRQNQGLTCKIVSQMAVYSISRLSRQLNSPIMSPQVQYSVNRVWDCLLTLWSLSIPKVGGELCSCKGKSQVRNS